MIVVLPNDYPFSEEILGWERFVFPSKVMVSQRTAGFDACPSDYVLALDDDVEFDTGFIEQLFSTIPRTEAQLASLIVKEFNN